MSTVANKRSKTKKPKQASGKSAGRKGGNISLEDSGSPEPVRKNKKGK